MQRIVSRLPRLADVSKDVANLLNDSLRGREPTGPYPYEKLPTTHHFRVLHLFPEFYDPPYNTGITLVGPKPLSGSLSLHYIDESVPYECLSYCWGTSQHTRTIWLDGYAMKIGRNLEAALLRLRQKNEARYLWIDQICINQCDFGEKGRQVQLMYTIYTQAERVLAWLGEKADGSEHIPKLCKDIVKGHLDFKEFHEDQSDHRGVQPWHYPTDKVWDDETLEDYGLPPAGHRPWKSFRAFLQRPWFTRVWIIQEAVAAKNLLFLCGDWTMDDSLIGAIMFAREHGLGIADFGAAKFDQRWPECAIWQLYLIQAASSSRGRHSYVLRQSDEFPQRLLDGRTTFNERPWSFLDLLEGSRQALCTEPRDKIYALLNLANDGPQLNIDVSYHMTVEELFKKVASALIESGQTGQMLTCAGTDESKLDLPSWVPDWSLKALDPGVMTDISNADLRTRSNSYSSCWSEAQILPSGDELMTYGVMLDRIDNVEPLPRFNGFDDKLFDKYVWFEDGDHLRHRALVTFKDVERSKHVWPSEFRLCLKAYDMVLNSSKYRSEHRMDVTFCTMLCWQSRRSDPDSDGSDDFDEDEDGEGIDRLLTTQGHEDVR